MYFQQFYAVFQVFGIHLQQFREVRTLKKQVRPPYHLWTSQFKYSFLSAQLHMYVHLKRDIFVGKLLYIFEVKHSTQFHNTQCEQYEQQRCKGPSHQFPFPFQRVPVPKPRCSPPARRPPSHRPPLLPAFPNCCRQHLCAAGFLLLINVSASVNVRPTLAGCKPSTKRWWLQTH